MSDAPITRPRRRRSRPAAGALALAVACALPSLGAQGATAVAPRPVVVGGGAGTALPVLEVRVEGPSHAASALQVLCLFRDTPGVPLRASLASTDSALHGLLAAVRGPTRFGGALGETLVLTAPQGTLPAHRLLLIGLGDPATFTADRMRLVGRVLLREADRLGVAHPYFAPAVIDGGVSNVPAEAVAEQVALGVGDAYRLARWLASARAATPPIVTHVTFLAGPAHQASTVAGIRRAMADTTGGAAARGAGGGRGPVRR